MKKNKKFKSRSRDDNKNSPFEDRKKFCPFSQKNSPSIDYMPEKYRRETMERILSFLRPMGEKEEFFVEKWDMSDFLEEESTRKKSDLIRRHFEGQ